MSYGKRRRESKRGWRERRVLEARFSRCVHLIARAVPSEAQPLIDEGVVLAEALGWCLWTAVASCSRRRHRPSDSAISTHRHHR